MTATTHAGMVTSPRTIRLSVCRDYPEYVDRVIPVERSELAEFRCSKCDRLLFKGLLTSGSIVEIMCSNKWCRDRHRINIFSVA